MSSGGVLFRILLRMAIRTALVVTLSLGLFASVVLISTETLTVWAGTLTLPSGYTVGPNETVELAPDVDTTVTLGQNLVVHGVLRSRPAAGVTHSIRFTGISEAAFVGGGNEPVPSDTGLWVADAGRLDLAGEEKLAWTRAASSISAGATTTTLEAAPAGWQVGDEVLIAPTESPALSGFSKHQETRTLTSVSGSTIGFGALAYAHPRVTVKPGVSYGAEIVNLTRSIRIEGQDATHRTHVWIKSSVPQSIRNVAIRHVAPQKGSPAGTVLGRYGLHFHRMGDASRGSLVEGVVIRETGGPAFATHASHGVTLRNTVAVDVQSVAYWYDPGAAEAPNDTLYDGALAASVNPTPKQGNAHRLTAFWLGSGLGNGCLRCVAFGVQGGKNASGFGWPEDNVGLWRFEDSLAHNNARNGIFVWQNNAMKGHVVDRFTAYHNGYSGIEHGAYTNQYQYRDAVLYGNATAGVILHATSPAQPPPTSFERPHVDGAGVTKHAVLLSKPLNLGQPPTLWCGATIVGLSSVPYFVSYSGEDASIAARLLILPACPSSVPVPPPPSGVPSLPPMPLRSPKGTVGPSTEPSEAPAESPSPSSTPGRGQGGPPKKR